MRTVSAIEVRKHFGKLVDEAAAGERLIIERAGQPVAAIVPLSDLPESTSEERIRRRLSAIAEIRRFAAERPVEVKTEAGTLIRRQRDERTRHIAGVLREANRKRR